MPTVFELYHSSMTEATLHVQEGNLFEDQDRAYYETRSFDRLQELEADEENPTRYQGLLKMESKVLILGSTHALAGEVISWECTSCPAEPLVAPVKKKHR